MEPVIAVPYVVAVGVKDVKDETSFAGMRIDDVPDVGLYFVLVFTGKREHLLTFWAGEVGVIFISAYGDSSRAMPYLPDQIDILCIARCVRRYV